MPTHRTGHEQQQDAILLKNLIGKAKERILRDGESTPTVEKLLEPLDKLRSDDLFFQNCLDGLACFCAAQFDRVYPVPLPLEPQWIVGRRFHIRPLLPLLQHDGRFYVLALTQQTARLLEASKRSIREIDLPEVSPIELDGDQQPLQYHSHKAPTFGKGATQAAIYHGHGGSTDRAKKDILRFFQLVDRAVVRELRGELAPLVLACVGYLAPLYESANHYQALIKGKVPGSPDRWTDAELRDHAWKLVEPHFRRKQEDARRNLQQMNGKDRSSTDLRTIVLAADQGRVDVLFVTPNEQQWGRVDPQRQTVDLTQDKQVGVELLDYAAAQTLSNGGDVYVVDSLVCENSPIAATFRY